MGMDAYALKFKGFVAFSEISQMFDEYGNLNSWEDRDWSIVDYSSPRMKEWCKTLPGFDESIHTHTFAPRLDFEATIAASGVVCTSPFQVQSYTDDSLKIYHHDTGNLIEIPANQYIYFPEGESCVFMVMSEEGYIRKPFFDYYHSASSETKGDLQLPVIMKSIDAKQVEDANMYFVTQSEIDQLTPFVNEYDRKNWDNNFNQPNTIVHLNW